MEEVVPSEVLVPLTALQNTRRHKPLLNQLNEIRCKDVDCIDLAQNIVPCRLVVHKAVKFRPHTNVAVA
jgi:hypothetical protein